MLLDVPKKLDGCGSIPDPGIEFPQWPCLIFGGPLHGDKPVRMIYVDEAGTSRRDEPTIVAAVATHPDSEWRAVKVEIDRVLDKHVPADVRKGFIFHGKEIYNGGKQVNRETWEFPSRLALIAEVASIPHRFGLPISIGVVSGLPSSVALKGALKNDSDNVKKLKIAFSICIAEADRYMRQHAPVDEIATLVCEDNKGLHQALKGVYRTVRDNPGLIGAHALASQVSGGVSIDPPENYPYMIEKIIDEPHFCSKSGSIMLQLADAAAFVARRFLDNQPYGDQLFEAMAGTAYPRNLIGSISAITLRPRLRA